MKQHNVSPKQEFGVALSYYKETVWKYISNHPLAGAQYAVAACAWERLDTAQRAWSESLDITQRADATAINIQDLRPRRLERDDVVKPEFLAQLASARLGTRKPRSVRAAIEDAYDILLAAHDYLDGLPKPKSKTALMVDTRLFSSVSFDEILKSFDRDGQFPLLPPVKPKRNGGKLTLKALKMALRRYAETAPGMIRNGIRHDLRNKVISCNHLEMIRWHRFKKHAHS